MLRFWLHELNKNVAKPKYRLQQRLIKSNSSCMHTIPCSIVEDSLIQYQIMPGFSESPLVQWAGWYSAAWDTTVPNVVPLLQSQVESSKLPSVDRYGIRLPIPLSPSGHEPNFCTMLTSLSAQFEEVKLTKGETSKYQYQNSVATSSKLPPFSK